MSKILILLTLLFLCFSLKSQVNSFNATDYTPTIEEKPLYEYVSLDSNDVYDVEIIVFAYQKTLPNKQTFINKAIFDDSAALELKEKPEDLNFTRMIDTQVNEDKKPPEDSSTNTSQFTVSLENEKDNLEVLTWFKHGSEFYQLTPIWEKLLKQTNITPLIHQAWRQTETEFNNPIYVKISNLVENKRLEEPLETDPLLITNTSVVSSDIEQININKPTYSDYTIKGMVALSRGRYIHFGNQLNLFRTYNDSGNDMPLKNMVFSLTERRQIKANKLHYFDSPWLGSIVKITKYKGEEQDVEANNE